MKRVTTRLLWLVACVALTACQSAYYSAMEQVGVHKRDILVDRVEDARDSQQQAQQEFQSALEQLAALTQFDGGELQDVYEQTQDAYDDSAAAAEDVTERINAVEDVADALFEEWRAELEQYSNAKYRRSSEQQLRKTKKQYDALMVKMRRAERSMAPVLDNLQDNALYLKHHLNAQAIGALQNEYVSIKTDIDALIAEMEAAIQASDAFIASVRQG